MRALYILILVIGFSPVLLLPANEGIVYFEKEIRPALVKYCYECHSAESGKSKGGLRVDTRDALLRGGDSGPSIVPGNPDERLFMTAIHYLDPDYEMPLKGKMPAEVITQFEKWISIGAPAPELRPGFVTPKIESGIDIEKGRQFWSFKKLINPTIPGTNNY